MVLGKEEEKNEKTVEGHGWDPPESEAEATIADTETPVSPLLSPRKSGENEGRFKATITPPSSPDDVENGNFASSELQVQKRSPTNVSSLSSVSHEKDNSSATGDNTVSSANPKAEVTASRFVRSGVPAVVNTFTSAARNLSFRAWLLPSKSSPTFRVKFHSAIIVGGSLPMKIAELSLRLGAVILSAISFSVMFAAAEERQGAGSTFKMKFSDFGAYNYLAAINVITFIYSILLLVMLILILRNEQSSSYKESLKVYAVDQVLAFLLFSASTAAATAAQLSRHGLQHIWPPACSTWKLSVFCSKADAAVTMSFFASFCVVGSAVISAYHLSKTLQIT